MEKIYRIGTRKSPLALKQVEEILNSLRNVCPLIKTEIVGIDTYGDRDRSTPISDVEGSDFFTREIDDALIKGKIDFAVHSAKDLPDKLRSGLTVAAITECLEQSDALISKSGLKLAELPTGAKIATSSRSRKDGLKKFRSDFCIIDIRGNIDERLKKLDSGGRSAAGKIDGIVLAACGLMRLGLAGRITEKIPFDIINPHPLQGRLAIVVRETDTEIINIFSIGGGHSAFQQEKTEALVWKKMDEYFGSDFKRINHARKVLGYAKKLLKKEKRYSNIVILSAILHDIGIVECERKYNSTNGQLQEKEGPPIAEKILKDLKAECPLPIDKKIIREVCRIIASHHSPGEINTADFKILYDADWMVNLRDTINNVPYDKKNLKKIIHKVFLTETGKKMAEEIYLNGKKR